MYINSPKINFWMIKAQSDKGHCRGFAVVSVQVWWVWALHAFHIPEADVKSHNNGTWYEWGGLSLGQVTVVSVFAYFCLNQPMGALCLQFHSAPTSVCQAENVVPKIEETWASIKWWISKAILSHLEYYTVLTSNYLQGELYLTYSFDVAT